ncbi:MAG: DUF4012 domain-containing protein [Candidatus Moraniibacteriota bacterium]
MHIPPKTQPTKTKKKLLIGGAILVILLLLTGGLFILKNPAFQKTIAINGLSALSKVAQLLPIQPDTKKELAVTDQLVSTLTVKDGVTRSYLILLQNTAELRPGGGFLGQYANLKIKDGTILSMTVEDANLLDQRIPNGIASPWPLAKIMRTRNWKFRDSNFSPDFPTNAAKAQYFCRLGGCVGGSTFDGVFAVNSQVLDDLIGVTGPITIAGIEYTSSNASTKLEEQVEKNYLGENVPAELKQARKNIMKTLATELAKRLVSLNNIPKLAELAQTEMRDKNVMLWFKDANLQSLAASVYWDGAVSTDWQGDYLMVVDANMGALKTDYYVKRSLDYTVDFTGEHPIATMKYTYNHTATQGDWRTSDYHTYARTLTPKGSIYLDRVLTGGVNTTQDFNKTIFGYKVDVLIGHNQTIAVKYQLPDTITLDNYQLLIQKQSGVGNIPVSVHLISRDGKTYDQAATLAKDLRLSFSLPEN